MPREPRYEITKVTSPNGIIAAAVRLAGGSKARKPKKAPPWYRQAWLFFDIIGEFRYACSWVGNLLSRATLEVWENGKPTKNEEAIAILASLYGGVDGQREMLRQMGTHMTVCGDLYLIGEDNGNDPDAWSVVAASNVRAEGTDNNLTWLIGNRRLNTPNVVIRLWRPHPFNGQEADSASRAALPILSEIENLSKHIAAQLASRLSGAGLLPLPNDISFGSVRTAAPNGDGTDTNIGNTGVDALLQEIMETMMAAIADPEDASAKTPILLQMPGEYIDKIKLVTFWTELDAQANSMRDAAVRRLATSMDMPPEVLTGTGDMNHWNAWQVEEAAIKAHTEPLLQIITQGLTTSYLQAVLIDNGMDVETARTFTIHADTSKIRLRPNRSKEAIELYDRGQLSGEAMLRENGFDPADAMAKPERVAWMTQKVASGSTTPEIVAAALSLMGIPIPHEILQAAETAPTQAPSDRSLSDHPTQELPQLAPDQDPSLNAAAVGVHRALERAGARIRSKYSDRLVTGTINVPTEDLYRFTADVSDIADDLLMNAWDSLERQGIDVAPATLDAYTRYLFRSGEVFSVRHFNLWMRRYRSVA